MSTSSAEKEVGDGIRLLIIDTTLTGNGTATGELKATLLREWDPANVAQLYGSGLERIGFSGTVDDQRMQLQQCSRGKALALAEGFQPHCILYRPTPDNQSLHKLAMKIIQTHPLPLVTWIMDDWPARLEQADPESFAGLAADLSWLFVRSQQCLCISEMMKDAFEDRYGVEFVPIANGVEPGEWSAKPAAYKSPLKIRYAGSLAEDMTLFSILDIAEVVQQLADEGHDIVFELNTRQHWASMHGHRFSRFSSCSISTDELSSADYRRFLQSADVLLIAYNFDDASTRYVQYSLANKLPECLISGNPLLVYGPAHLATVALMKSELPESVVTEEDRSALRSSIAKLAESESARRQLAEDGYQLALNRFQLSKQREALCKVIQDACSSPFRHEIRRADRAEHAQLDECAMIAALFASEDDSPERRMIDVGAHYGSALKPFADRGWSVLAFEPDEENGDVLEKRYGDQENVLIDRRAVAEEEFATAVFYSSSVSTGIRGMLPFHASHREAAPVEVTNLDRVTADLDIRRVDFLKIDVEGYDLAVLKGFPWERLAPDVLICEFEDAKTQQLGHTWQDIAEFLTSHNYTVFVSEWYPIIRYGIPHDWRSIREYPCELAHPDAWGNLLAFRNPPSIEVLAEVIDESIDQTEGSSLNKRLKWAIRFAMSIVRTVSNRIRSRLG